MSRTNAYEHEWSAGRCWVQRQRLTGRWRHLHHQGLQGVQCLQLLLLILQVLLQQFCPQCDQLTAQLEGFSTCSMNALVSRTLKDSLGCNTDFRFHDSHTGQDGENDLLAFMISINISVTSSSSLPESDLNAPSGGCTENCSCRG